MKDSKWRSKRWRRANFFTVLVGVAFIGVFYQPWRVYAFDLQEAVANASATAAQAVSQPAAKTAKTTSAAVSAPSSPDRWSDGDVVSALSSFYQTVIACLGLLLGVVGVLAVVTLRFLSRAAAEDIAHESAKAAMQHYLDTRQFYEVVEYAVQETHIASQLEQLAVEKEAITKQLSQLASELQSVKQKFRKQQEQIPSNAPSENTPSPHDASEDVDGQVASTPPDESAHGPEEGSN